MSSFQSAKQNHIPIRQQRNPHSFKKTTGLPSSNKQKQQFKLSSNKILSYRTKCQSIQELLDKNIPITSQNNKQSQQQLNNIIQIRAMHSQSLSTTSGIHMFKNCLVSLNLSSNVISSLDGISSLTKLQVFQIKNNKLTSLKGVQKCLQLKKIDASNNFISTYEGLNQINQKKNKIERIILPGNCFSDLEGIECVKKLSKIKQIVFMKGKSSNPICENYGDYIFLLGQFLISRDVIVDDMTLKEHMKCLEIDNSGNQRIEKSYDATENQISEQIYAKTYINNPNINTNKRLIQSNSGNGFQRSPLQNPGGSPYLTNNKAQISNQLLLTQQQLYQTQSIIQYKNQQIQDLKMKTSNLQIQNSTQYKELIKKQTQFQRVSHQNSQLLNQLNKKQKSLSQMHKRVQQILKSSAQSSKLIQNKNKQIDRLKQEISDLRLEMMEYKTLSKDYQKRLNQMHEKTLVTIQERTLKQDELKRKYEQIYEENFCLVKDKQQIKDRMRELTQLLREWEFKYENKVAELQAKHLHEKQELLKQYEQKISATTEHYQHELHKMDQDMRVKVQQIQMTYKGSLQQAYEKHKKLKNAYQQKTKSLHERQVFLKGAHDKNQELQSIISQFKEIVFKMRNQLQSIEKDRQNKARQLYQVKYHYTQQNGVLEDKLNKVTYEKSRLEKQLMDLRQNNAFLSSETQAQSKYQKLYQQLQQKYQDIQTALDVKTQLLQDKNQTIQSLKEQIQLQQKQNLQKVDGHTYDSLRKKYQKSKKQNQQYVDQTTRLLEQLEEIRRQNQDYRQIVGQFEKNRLLLVEYEKMIEEKDSQNSHLIKFIEQAKRTTQIQRQEMNQVKRQYKRLQSESDRRERELRSQIRELEVKYRKQVQEIKIQSQKYKKNAIQELQSVFIKLQSQK